MRFLSASQRINSSDTVHDDLISVYDRQSPDLQQEQRQVTTWHEA